MNQWWGIVMLLSGACSPAAWVDRLGTHPAWRHAGLADFQTPSPTPVPGRLPQPALLAICLASTSSA
jgi:hypothetical protein